MKKHDYEIEKINQVEDGITSDLRSLRADYLEDRERQEESNIEILKALHIMNRTLLTTQIAQRDFAIEVLPEIRRIKAKNEYKEHRREVLWKALRYALVRGAYMVLGIFVIAGVYFVITLL